MSQHMGLVLLLRVVMVALDVFRRCPTVQRPLSRRALLQQERLGVLIVDFDCVAVALEIATDVRPLDNGLVETLYLLHLCCVALIPLLYLSHQLVILHFLLLYALRPSHLPF